MPTCSTHQGAYMLLHWKAKHQQSFAASTSSKSCMKFHFEFSADTQSVSGVPYTAVIAVAILSCLSYLALGSSTAVVLNWILKYVFQINPLTSHHPCANSSISTLTASVPPLPCCKSFFTQPAERLIDLDNFINHHRAQKLDCHVLHLDSFQCCLESAKHRQKRISPQHLSIPAVCWVFRFLFCIFIPLVRTPAEPSHSYVRCC